MKENKTENINNKKEGKKKKITIGWNKNQSYLAWGQTIGETWLADGLCFLDWSLRPPDEFLSMLLIHISILVYTTLIYGHIDAGQKQINVIVLEFAKGQVRVWYRFRALNPGESSTLNKSHVKDFQSTLHA